ncbi:hypothetical protein HYR99_30320 [Candidatus Poribacteria bacterium]|nr:hypothetical protein [Candidatus Poribacteria bacterium]
MVRKAKSLLAKQRQRPKKTLREIVVCPLRKGRVEREKVQIRCGRCNVVYPIIDGIPRLLPPRSNKMSK